MKCVLYSIFFIHIQCIKMGRIAINLQKNADKTKIIHKKKGKLEGTGMKNRFKEMVSS
jgi:hypothetical protein